MCHLLGSSRVINSMTSFVASGGLGEAAAWVCLRQNIYVAITTNTRLELRLDAYKHSQSFGASTDCAWTNQIVLIFAEILNSLFDTDDSSREERWHELQQAAESWLLSKPDTFAAILSSSLEETSVAEGPDFPEIWMLQPAHVIGLQYYHLARILLASSDPRKSRLGFTGMRSWRDTEVCTHSHRSLCTMLLILPSTPSEQISKSSLAWPSPIRTLVVQISKLLIFFMLVSSALLLCFLPDAEGQL